MKIHRTYVYGFEAALMGMRNPLNSWEKSDSVFNDAELYHRQVTANAVVPEFPVLGPADLGLATKLVAAGASHRKFLRQISVWMQIEIARYLWQELDTYKVATVRISCSTMHKLGSRELTADDFEGGDVNLAALTELNDLGRDYRKTKSVETLTAMKRRLPEGYLQMAMWSCNYETALKIIADRGDHRLREWREIICPHLLTLPYLQHFDDARRR